MSEKTASGSGSGSTKHHALWLVLLAASCVFGLTMGTRQSMGLFLSSLNTSTGLGLASISLAFAFGQIFWGLTQPFAGAYADRYGATRVLLVGIALVAVGTFMTPYMTSTAGLILAIGVLAAGGAGIAGPAVLMGATARMIPLEKQGVAIGVVNAGGSFGQFMMAPIAGALLVGIGWFSAMQVLAMFVLLAIPAALVFRGNFQFVRTGANAMGVPQKPVSAMDAIKGALKNPSYLMLGGGFFVCGFHVAFLGTHLPHCVGRLRAANAMGRLVTGHAGTVQHHWQPDDGLGHGPVADEVPAVHGLHGAGYCCHRIFDGAQNRPGDVDLCGGDGFDVFVHRAAHGRFGCQVLRHRQPGHAVWHCHVDASGGRIFWRLSGREDIRCHRQF